MDNGKCVKRVVRQLKTRFARLLSNKHDIPICDDMFFQEYLHLCLKYSNFIVPLRDFIAKEMKDDKMLPQALAYYDE